MNHNLRLILLPVASASSVVSVTNKQKSNNDYLRTITLIKPQQLEDWQQQNWSWNQDAPLEVEAWGWKLALDWSLIDTGLGLALDWLCNTWQSRDQQLKLKWGINSAGPTSKPAYRRSRLGLLLALLIGLLLIFRGRRGMGALLLSPTAARPPKSLHLSLPRGVPLARSTETL